MISTLFNPLSLIISYASKNYKNLETFRHVSTIFRDVISHNPLKVWNRFFQIKNTEYRSEQFLAHLIQEGSEVIQEGSEVIQEGSEVIQEGSEVIQKELKYPFHALCIAAKFKHLEIFRELWKDFNIDDRIILFVACRYGHPDIVKEISKEHINICFDYFIAGDERDVVCLYFRGEITKYMFEYDEDFNFYEVDDCYAKEVFFGTGSSPLHAACSSGNFEIVRYLVLNGAQVNIYYDYDEYSTTPARQSLISGDNFRIFNYLYLKGAKITSHGYERKFASPYGELLYSCVRGDEEILLHNPDLCTEENYSRIRRYARALIGNNQQKILRYGDPVIIVESDLVHEYIELLIKQFEEMMNDASNDYICRWSWCLKKLRETGKFESY